MAVQNISLTNPYTLEQEEIKRRRKIYEALQAKSMEEDKTEVIGGWAIPNSPLKGLSKVAQALAGAYGQHKLGEQEKALGERQASDRSRIVLDAIKAGEARPVMPEGWGGEPGSPDEIYRPEVPGQPANPRQTYAALASQSNFPELQTLGLTGLLPKPQEPYTLGPDQERRGPNNELLARGTSRPQADNRPEILRLQEVLAGLPKDDPRGAQINERIAMLTTRGTETGNWSEPYQMGGAWVQKNDATGQVRQAVAREPRTSVHVAPPVTVGRVVDPRDPTRMLEVDARTYRGGSLGDPGVIGVSGRESATQGRENKRQFSMQGLGDALQKAEDLLTGVRRTSDGEVVQGTLPTGSLVGSIVDTAAGAFGMSPPGSVEAADLKVVGGVLTSKVPRFEGPQSDKDTALYKQMAAEAANDKIPRDRRLSAVRQMRALYAEYETGGRGRLLPESASPSPSGITPINRPPTDRRGADRRGAGTPPPPPGFVPDR